MPLTTDYAAAKIFISNLNTEMVEVQGTEIGTRLIYALSHLILTTIMTKQLLLLLMVKIMIKMQLNDLKKQIKKM